MRTLFFSLAVFAAACGSLRELSPETAASRISSSDGYKEEACAMAQRYATQLGKFRWEGAKPIELIDQDELTHMQAVFERRPSISCRIKVDKYLHDLGSKALLDLTAAVATMQIAYQAIPEGESLLDCDACEFSDYTPTGPLVSYYKAPIFGEARKRHSSRFAALCLDVENADKNAAAVNAHATHHEARLNPLFERHGGCDWVWKTYFANNSGACARYGDKPYMICALGVWRTDGALARPMTYFGKEYRKLDWFGAGFVVTLADGRSDVYWLENETLVHSTGDAGTPARLVDYDGDQRNDVVMGDFLVLARRNGTGTRTTVTTMRAKQAAGERVERVRQFEDTFTRLPLTDVEQLLGGEYAENPVLLDRAADASYEWWSSASREQRATLERIEAYWHALLWNGVTHKHAIGDEYFKGVLAATQPPRAEQRRADLTLARRNGEAAKVFAECGALRGEAARAVDELEAAVAGTAAAEEAVGALWQRYRGVPLPKEGLAEALAASKRNQEDLTAFLTATCL